jgi:branched-chain amino acid transport system permease protein
VPRSGDRATFLWVLGFALLAVVLVALPHLLSFSQQEILVLLVINVLLVCSYRLLTLTGEWSLAHAVIMGVGAYASGLCAKELGIPVPISMVIGAATAGFLAFLLSFPLFRMKGFYFLIGSFAAGEVIRLMWKWSDLTFLFGGPKGIKRIPPFPNILTIDFYEPSTGRTNSPSPSASIRSATACWPSSSRRFSPVWRAHSTPTMWVRWPRTGSMWRRWSTF